MWVVPLTHPRKHFRLGYHIDRFEGELDMARVVSGMLNNDWTMIHYALISRPTEGMVELSEEKERQDNQVSPLSVDLLNAADALMA